MGSTNFLTPDIALQRAVANYLQDDERNAIGVARIRGLANPSARPARRFAPVPSAELGQWVRRARQHDKGAALEVLRALAARLRRGQLADPERDLLASMVEAIVKGVDPACAMLLAKPSNRASNARMQAFVADTIAREIEAHDAIKARGGPRCDNGCRALTDTAAFENIGAAFGMSKSRAKAIYLASRKAQARQD